MNKDIETYVSQCAVCNSYKPHQQKEPLKMHPVPDRPWSYVATDLFMWNRLDYLVTVDSYSGWYEINSLPNTTSRTVIQKLKNHFSRFGVPDSLFSDNGSVYCSHEFKQFAKEWGFKHITSSPHFPQSNSYSERAVQSAKTLLEKCKRDGSDPYIALLNQRNIPRDDVLGSPAQRLLARRIKSNLPIAKSLLEPKVVPTTQVHAQLTHKRMQQKKYFDKTAKSLPPLQRGDK
uniref:uncharacterized protein K02A2.6-like n=1 Tax=Styela clava TaxID=7725 RepID=UPI00193A1331|nr:uncharacterized protein K02A2.6-like [Styela clava]